MVRGVGLVGGIDPELDGARLPAFGHGGYLSGSDGRAAVVGRVGAQVEDRLV